MKNYSGSIGMICLKPHLLHGSTKKAITRIGVEFPRERLVHKYTHYTLGIAHTMLRVVY